MLLGLLLQFVHRWFRLSGFIKGLFVIVSTEIQSKSPFPWSIYVFKLCLLFLQSPVTSIFAHEVIFPSAKLHL